MSYIFSEEQEIDRLEMGIAQQLYHICTALGKPFSSMWHGPFRWGGVAAFPHEIRLLDHVQLSSDSDAKRSLVWFNSVGYIDAEREVDMTNAVVRKLPNDHDGWHRVYDASAMRIQQEVAVKMTLTQKHSEQYNQQVKFGITNKTSVGGAIKGVNISNDLTLTAESQFGVTTYNDVVKSSDFSETTQIDVPLGSKISVDCDVHSIEKRIPIVESAYVDFDLTLRIGSYDTSFGAAPGKDWWRRPDGGYADYQAIHCGSIRELLNLLEGKRSIEYPGMNDFLSRMRAQAYPPDESQASAWNMQLARNALMAYDWLNNRENFRVRASKTHVLYEQNAGEVVTKAL